MLVIGLDKVPGVPSIPSIAGSEKGRGAGGESGVTRMAMGYSGGSGRGDFPANIDFDISTVH